MCLHPGCGKVFHLKASAARHQEKEHRFRRRLGEGEGLYLATQCGGRHCLSVGGCKTHVGVSPPLTRAPILCAVLYAALSHVSLLAPAAPTPLTDQYMSPAWPKDGVPWVPGSQARSHSHPSGPPTTGPTTSPHRRRRNGKVRAKGAPPTHSSSRRRNAGTGHRTGSKSGTEDAGLAQDEADVHARFACGVPGCGHRFSEARLLALHLRMGHNDFDLEKMKAAREGTEQTYTLDGVSITAPVDVGGRVRSAMGRACGNGKRSDQEP